MTEGAREEAALFRERECRANRMNSLHRRRRNAGLCVACGAESATYRCADCQADRRLGRQMRRERLPAIRKFEIALTHVRNGLAPRDALYRAGILGPLERGEI